MPFEQDRFKLAFVPMKDGKVTSDWEVFIADFVGPAAVKNPGKAGLEGGG